MKELSKQICISCDYQHTERYCPNCGEISNLRKITFKAVFREAFSTFTNMDKGFLYNLRGLTFNPKTFIQGYLSGKRRGIFNPISYLIISISLYLILENIFPIYAPNMPSDATQDTIIYKIGYQAGKIITEYFKFFWIMSVFFLAAPTALLYRKRNFAEHVTVAAFLIGHSTLLVAFLTPLLKLPLIFNYVLYSFILILHFRFYLNLDDKAGSFMVSFLVALIFFVELFLFAIFLGAISYFLF
ncbi:MAG: hypothetical protein BalsKO_12490 [Balneolaceae bacterium]